jgi:predicted ATPase
MSSRRKRGEINLPAPYLRRVWLDASRITAPEAYPFCLPLFAKGDFELDFDRAVTIIVGENGTHAPILMAYPNARLLRLSKYGLEPVTLEQTEHFRLIREFCADPGLFLETMLSE